MIECLSKTFLSNGRMKLRESTNVQASSTLRGEEIAMDVDPEAMAHVLQLLSGLYTDPVLAVVREYSTNAWDAHVEAGTDRPIEVELPGELSPFLKIRDFGVGLSREDIQKVYSRYGASTKRSSDEFNGMMGIGCKSAFGYTTQFVVSSVKDGRGCSVVVSKTADESGSMTIEREWDTDEQNGTTVTIPVKTGDAEEFRRKAKSLFSYWKSDTVLVDGNEPVQFEGDTVEWITDHIAIVSPAQTYGNREDIIVMGGVPYSIPESLGRRIECPIRENTKVHVVYFSPIGLFDIPASREYVKDTDRSKQFLKSVGEEVSREISDYVSSALEECDNRWEALSLSHKIASTLKINVDRLSFPIEFDGEAIPMAIPLPKGTFRLRESYDKTVRINDDPYVSISEFVSSSFATGFNLKRPTRHHYFKTRHIIESSDLADGVISDVIFFPDGEDDSIVKWANQDLVFDFQTVRDTKIASTKRSSTAGYRYWYYPDNHWDNRGSLEDILDLSSTILYIEPHKIMSDYSGLHQMECHELYGEDYVVVGVPESRQNAFKNKCRKLDVEPIYFPDAVDKAAQDIIDEVLGQSPSYAQIAHRAIGGWASESHPITYPYAIWDDKLIAKIDDPQLREVIEAWHLWSDNNQFNEASWAVRRAARNKYMGYSKEDIPKSVAFEDTTKRYDLFSGLRSSDADFIIELANIIYFKYTNTKEENNGS